KHDIAWLQIAVDDALRMGVRHAVADLQENLCGTLLGELLLLFQDFSKISAFNQLHKKERPAVMRNPKALDLNDIGMAETAGSGRFLFEALEADFFGNEIGMKNFDGVKLIVSQNRRLVDRACGACSQPADDFVFCVELGPNQ